MSTAPSVFWGNTSHWGVTNDGVLLVLSMALCAGWALPLGIDLKNMGCVVAALWQKGKLLTAPEHPQGALLCPATGSALHYPAELRRCPLGPQHHQDTECPLLLLLLMPGPLATAALVRCHL